MLRSLTIRDFVIVHALDLDLADGFTVFTGETGAGKSILIDALALTLGERADAAVVREGAPRADITAAFDTHPQVTTWLEAHELHGDDGTILLRRTVDAAGRSKAFINGAAVTLAQLREVGEQLVDIHGQHAHQLLLKTDAQRRLLDAHAGLEDEVRTVGERYRAWQAVVRLREAAEQQSREAQLERERVEWQVNELQKLAPQPGEWEDIQAEHHRLSHAASLIEGTRAALDALSESDGAVLTQLGAAVHSLQALAEIDPALADVLAALEPAQVQVQEAVHSLARYADRAELDPDRLAEVDARLQALHTMARKYRVAPETLPAELAQRQAQLAALQAASDLDALQAQEAQTHAAYLQAAQALSRGRAKAARELANAVTGAMQGLSMAGGRFDIALHPLEHGGAAGLEQVEFLVAGHAGVSPRPLAKVASGGELARISLAISVIASEASPTPTLIFDEVDSGIGGAVAEVVGRRLRELGTRRQVLCVTHLPQVAALANHHVQVAKQTVGGSTRSDLVVLDATGRVDEIARMLGGASLTDTTRRHADEMLAAGRAHPAPASAGQRKSRRAAQ
ncbi:DNA repair protein RecN [Ralstonia syzygii subsp. celebesensis]|uniref:DNA repair protein RecN n=3 Tax=Ralstonia solanacearum species complex TaxID=3116862 RepID=A0AAD0S6S8_RALSL|nr:MULTISPECIES: DNA repair protein RecN [Ralstonia solanacearum species complex]CCA79734.1 DNA repair protein recN (Recombination protein N) [blood disease bacterium R229]AQW29388.1 DNA repair protein RecN [blood disease bacterium A2-HR MARDI]AXV80724.1 DNA repair protein RecN [Ralstonia solanacearum]AXW51872.1 DNA repair protein RecN [Ralstonia solanacearum]QQV56740.1 DNA repair protein RecN [Ralstonia syzygii subsp. celebesensis]